MRATKSFVSLRTSAKQLVVPQPPSAVSSESSKASSPSIPASIRASDHWILGGLLTSVSLMALWMFFRRDEILLSGDAVAHINIARRVFDSRTPGPLQLGTVWLPLPHLLTIPFVIGRRMWQSGIGGSIVSMLSYIAAGFGLFRLLSQSSRLAAWIGTLAFVFNPNLIYTQTTALNEPLYLASFIWSVVFFTEASRRLRAGEERAGASLEQGAIALTAAVLTRYDGWFLACTCWAAILPSAVQAMRSIAANEVAGLRKAVFRAVLLTALGPALWMAYNFGAFGNALEFATGPYSARAIAQRTSLQGAPPYPGERDLWNAGLYFVKAAQLNIGEGTTAKLLVLMAFFASVAFAFRGDWVVIMLMWSPLLFYSLSIAYGSVPIFIPVWWPFSYYNVRYGLELLPAIAAGLGFLVPTMRIAWRHSWSKPVGVCLVLVLATISYVETWRSGPICLREARVNGQARMELDRRLSAVIATIPPYSNVLAYTGGHPGAFQLAGFPLRQTINEGNFLLWDASLQHPASAAPYALASDGDAVASAIAKHPAGLIPIATLSVQGQPQAVLYKTRIQ